MLHGFMKYSVLAAEGGYQELTLISHSNKHTMSGLSDTERGVHTSTCLLFVGDSVNRWGSGKPWGELSSQASLGNHSQQ